MPKHPPVHYGDYLRTNELLSLQHKRSDEFGQPAHDEMLFIIVHQTYELWFKQILTELESVRAIFLNPSVDETRLTTAVARLDRVVEIDRLLIDQVTVLETMTALDFLDFREFLYPASGFQSTQFRMIENRLGLKSETRLPFNAQPYHAHLPAADQAQVRTSETDASIYELIEKWLERTPFLETQSYNFWSHYRTAVANMFNGDRDLVRANQSLNTDDRERNLKEIDAAESTFSAFFDENKFNELRSQGLWRMSHRALQAALLIQIYRDQPILHLPYRLLKALQDIDELMTTWRYRHALMAQRMLGSKVGTGGSSGHSYLRAATEKHRIYGDLSNLATFLIPRSKIPPLPKDISAKVGFFYQS